MSVKNLYLTDLFLPIAIHVRVVAWLADSFKMFIESFLCSLDMSRYVETIPYVYTFCLSFTISFISIAVFAC